MRLLIDVLSTINLINLGVDQSIMGDSSALYKHAIIYFMKQYLFMHLQQQKMGGGLVSVAF